ncbi:MAG: hypothetical protein U0457_21770 [Candidatus Sericytochromatia bacterium]
MEVYTTAVNVKTGEEFFSSKTVLSFLPPANEKVEINFMERIQNNVNGELEEKNKYQIKSNVADYLNYDLLDSQGVPVMRGECLSITENTLELNKKDLKTDNYKLVFYKANQPDKIVGQREIQITSAVASTFVTTASFKHSFNAAFRKSDSGKDAFLIDYVSNMSGGEQYSQPVSLAPINTQSCSEQGVLSSLAQYQNIYNSETRQESITAINTVKKFTQDLSVDMENSFNYFNHRNCERDNLEVGAIIGLSPNSPFSVNQNPMKGSYVFFDLQIESKNVSGKKVFSKVRVKLERGYKHLLVYNIEKFIKSPYYDLNIISPDAGYSSGIDGNTISNKDIIFKVDIAKDLYNYDNYIKGYIPPILLFNIIPISNFLPEKEKIIFENNPFLKNENVSKGIFYLCASNSNDKLTYDNYNQISSTEFFDIYDPYSKKQYRELLDWFATNNALNLFNRSICYSDNQDFVNFCRGTNSSNNSNIPLPSSIPDNINIQNNVNPIPNILTPPNDLYNGSCNCSTFNILGDVCVNNVCYNNDKNIFNSTCESTNKTYDIALVYNFDFRGPDLTFILLLKKTDGLYENLPQIYKNILAYQRKDMPLGVKNNISVTLDGSSIGTTLLTSGLGTFYIDQDTNMFSYSDKGGDPFDTIQSDYIKKQSDLGNYYFYPVNDLVTRNYKWKPFQDKKGNIKNYMFISLAVKLKTKYDSLVSSEPIKGKKTNLQINIGNEKINFELSLDGRTIQGPDLIDGRYKWGLKCK